MLAKYWKKIGLVILIIACIINIGHKIIQSTPLKEQLEMITSNVNSSENLDNTEKIEENQN